MGRRKVLKRLSVLIIMALCFLLVACAASDKTESDNINQQSDAEQRDQGGKEDVSTDEGEEQESTEDETESEVGSNTEYESCKGILFSVSQEIEGSVLGDCIVEAMLAQQSGSHIVKDESGIHTTVDFKWDPHFSLAVDNEEFAVILKEDTGWMKTLDGRWIQEDPNSDHPEVRMANTIIQGYRVFADPRFIAELLGMVNTWTVVGEEKVPDREAFTDTAWKLTSDDVIDMQISVISDFEFWITSDYLGAYFVATGSAGGISVQTSNTFTQWGDEVDIPDPEQ